MVRGGAKDEWRTCDVFSLTWATGAHGVNTEDYGGRDLKEGSLWSGLGFVKFEMPVRLPAGSV